jgi:hypothetical protein
MRTLSAIGIVAALVLAAPAAWASTITVGTFADPAGNSSTPLFTIEDTTLSGGWSGTGLTLAVPVASATYHDATFTITDLSIVDAEGALSGGSIQFYDNASNPVLKIDFAGAQLLAFISPPFAVVFGFAAADAGGHDVTITGAGVPAGLTDEFFAFSFANQTLSGDTGTWTASFTSSAVPEPASLALLAAGIGAMARRR